ncbi:hypothetical protein ELI01_18740 [Rhizobium leguminosarum]|uniref:hypothetical protein n=1 Tax=Rhizobium leguminosarum TaxID=384 RepID=UPI00102F4F42|nr:hypothetical protein [Rhizobium leguminosarum]TAX57118.1 hypothetical protein ELI01_18740 [Rhizobium leguminosarum]
MTTSYLPISVTASATLNRKTHAGTTTVINAAAGLTLTLPAASGTGDEYTIFVGTTVTSNNAIVQVANSTDIMQGVLSVATDIAGVTCPTTTTSDTITMNGSTTGGIKGSYIVLKDMASGTWEVSGSLVSSGTEATPFSAAV